MIITPYGVKPTLKKLMAMTIKKSGWRKMYISTDGLDMNEEEC